MRVPLSWLGELVDLGLAELGSELAQLASLLVIQLDRAEQLVVGEVEQPLDLDPHAGPIEAGLGEVLPQRRDRGSVASVERAQRLFGQAHEAPCRIPGVIWRKSAAHAFWIMTST